MEHMTAKVSCFARAFHYKHNFVHIFRDENAEVLLGADYEEIAGHMTAGIPFFLPGFTGTQEEGLEQIVNHQLSPSVLGRSAYCERMLVNARTLGCHQYLIFGAGFDTCSMKFYDSDLSVYELDLPEMLEEKQRRLDAIQTRHYSTFVPCNLAESDWKDRLISAGFSTKKPFFGSLLGLTYYLAREDFRSLIAGIASISAAGTALCFDYPSVEESEETKTNSQLAQGAGEQMKATYAYSELEELLHDAGFLIYEHLNDTEMTEQYFALYNRFAPEHTMHAPKGVGYVLAVKRR